MREKTEVSISALRGQTLASVDYLPPDLDCEERFLLTTVDGRTYEISHHQECSESVQLEETEGDWQKIIGRVIVDAEKHTIKVSRKNETGDVRLTELVFRTDEHTLIQRWIGESNGYYGIEVDVYELEKIAS